jgi:gamma-glutamyl-gamma-aminobutyrate hydrolase PuuD
VSFSDGLILQGGNDICPSAYNQPNQTAKNIAQFRDVFELSLIQVALQKQIPILGICRGMQLLNISFGGNLHQELDNGKWIKHSAFNGGNDTDAKSLDKIHEVDLVENGNLVNNWIGKNFFGDTQEEVVELARQDLEAIILKREGMVRGLIEAKKESRSQNANDMIVSLILHNQRQLNSFKESCAELKSLKINLRN